MTSTKEETNVGKADAIFDSELKEMLHSFDQRLLNTSSIRKRLLQVGCLKMKDIDHLSEDTYQDIFAPIFSHTRVIEFIKKEERKNGTKKNSNTLNSCVLNRRNKNALNSCVSNRGNKKELNWKKSESCPILTKATNRNNIQIQ